MLVIFVIILFYSVALKALGFYSFDVLAFSIRNKNIDLFVWFVW